MPSGLDFTILPEEVRSVLMWLIPGGYLQLVFIWLCGVFGLVTSKGNASSRILSAAGRGILIYFILEIVMVLIAFGFLIASQTLSLDMVVGEADISFESMKTLLIFIFGEYLIVDALLYGYSFKKISRGIDIDGQF